MACFDLWLTRLHSYDLPHEAYTSYVYPRQSSNGSAKSDPMVIDLSSDDDEDRSASVSPPEFEDEEDEIDPAKPYRDILRQIDIPLDAPILRIAIPHIPKDIAQAPPDSWPSVFL